MAMAAYTQVRDPHGGIDPNWIIRNEDGRLLSADNPDDAEDWQAFIDWLNAGNTPDPAPELPPPPPPRPLPKSFTQVRDPVTGGVNPNLIHRDDDGVWIPRAEGNADWREYQRWLAAGNTPHPPPPSPEPPRNLVVIPVLADDPLHRLEMRIAELEAHVAELEHK